MKTAIAALMLGAALTTMPAYAEEKAPPAEAATPAFSSSATTIGDILDNAEAKAVVEKHLPGFSSHPQIDMARSFTLKAVQGFQPEMITDEILAKIDADFAAMAAPKAS
jgi:hypothetical protein